MIKTGRLTNWIPRSMAVLTISLSCTLFAQPESVASDLNFKLTDPNPKQPIKLTRYQHQSSIGIELISKYEFSNWLSLSLDMDGQAYEVAPNQKQINYKGYSAAAQMGREFLFNKSSLRPFAQIGLGFSEDSRTTFYDPYHYERQSFDNTDLQYGLGVRYSRSDWDSFGVSFIYENQSALKDQKLPRFDSSLQGQDSIGLSVDFGF